MSAEKQHVGDDLVIDVTDRGIGRAVALEEDLGFAVEREQVTVVFQPVVDLEGRGVVAVEALARWSHPEWGPVAPDIFVPMAEAAGQIARIERLVMRSAFSASRDWNDSDVPLVVGVNVAPTHFLAPDFVEEVRALTSDTGARPERLEFEIAETAAIHDVAGTAGRIQDLRSLGFETAIDEFGSSEPSIGYLSRLPVHTVKLGRGLVDAIGVGQNEGSFVSTLVQTARAAGATIVAAGIERADQLSQARSLGCEQGQGFLFSEPISRAAVTRFCRGWGSER
ncbi:MAG: EAL domain-containing protein [Actinomycetota bacterium]